MDKVVFEHDGDLFVIDSDTGKFYPVGNELTSVTDDLRTAAIAAVADINRHLI